jgi:hypothetical protein
MYTVDDLLSKGDDFAGFLISCGANRFFSPGTIFEYFADAKVVFALLCYARSLSIKVTCCYLGLSRYIRLYLVLVKL